MFKNDCPKTKWTSNAIIHTEEKKNRCQLSIYYIKLIKKKQMLPICMNLCVHILLVVYKFKMKKVKWLVC